MWHFFDRPTLNVMYGRGTINGHFAKTAVSAVDQFCWLMCSQTVTMGSWGDVVEGGVGGGGGGARRLYVHAGDSVGGSSVNYLKMLRPLFFRTVETRTRMSYTSGRGKVKSCSE